MSIKYKIEGYDGLVRDSNSKCIVNTNVSEYQLYMQEERLEKVKTTKIKNVQRDK